MSRCISIIIAALTLFLNGCAPSTTPTKVENESLLVLEALDLKERGEYVESISKFEDLFDKTQNRLYLKEVLKSSFSANLPIDPKYDDLLKELLNEGEIARSYTGWLLRQDRIEEAKTVMQELLEKEKNVKNLNILGSIYLYQKEYNLALKYFDAIYKEEPEENTLMMIVELLDTHLNRTNEAISYLQTHSRMQKCTKTICYKLIQIYGKTKNLDGLLSTYHRLYDEFKEDEYADRTVELMLFQKDTNSAIKFLNKTEHDPLLLMDIHASQKEFSKAFLVAKRAYEKSADLNFLGLMAIYEYEDAGRKEKKEMLDSVSKKFDTVSKGLEDPLFLNYYGYLLIEHDLDIEKGIDLVKRALLQEPDSPYYIDSLAWGYYKLGDCEKAMDIILTIMSKIDEPEVKEHYEIIKKCLEEKR